MKVFEKNLINKISKSHFYIKLFMISSFYLGSISVINVHIHEFINKYYAIVPEAFKKSFVLLIVSIFVFAFLFIFIFEGIENLVKYLNINEHLSPSRLFFSFYKCYCNFRTSYKWYLSNFITSFRLKPTYYLQFRVWLLTFRNINISLCF